MNLVRNSILDAEELTAQTIKQEAAIQRTKQTGSFENAFRPLHDSFIDNEEEVVSALVSGVKNNLTVVSLPNVDAVVDILARLGQIARASELINFVVREAPSDFWLQEDPFHRALLSDRLKQVTTDRREAAEPKLDFEKDLIAAAQNFNREKLSQLAALSQEDYLKLFESKTGEEMRRVVLSALDFRRISNASSDMRQIVKNAESALRTLGKRSALNAFRVQKFGVILTEGDGAEENE
jgi:hypothetical protein